MDDNYPTLKRSKKKLTYPTTQTSLNQWTQEKMTLEDVDKMFDDLDSKGADDLPSPSPEIHIPNKKHVGRNMSPVPLKEQYSEELPKYQMVDNGDHPPLRHTSTSPDLDIDSEILFKAHGPVKTSSPIEGKAIQHKHKGQNKENDCKDNSASPILFDCEEEANLVSEPAEKPFQKPQHNNHRRDESDDSIFETLPRKAVLTKIDCRSKTLSPPVSPVRPEPTSGAPEKQTESAQMPSRVKHDMNSFLQKLRDAGQPKPARAGMSQPKVMPQPLEPEDDFLILEDDAPLYVSIPNKSVKSFKEKQNKTSSSDKETKDTSGEGQSVDKQQHTEQQSRKQETQTLNENPKKKAKKDKVSQSHSNESDIDKDQHTLPMFEPNSKNLLDQGKTKKKKIQMKKITSNNDNQADNKDQVTETDDENSSEITEKKTMRTVEKKGSKSLQNKKGNVQKKRTLASKQSRKGSNRHNAITDVIEQRQECAREDAVNNDALVSEDIGNLETEPTKDLAEINLKQNISSSSIKDTSDDRVLGKRKRKQPGQWWISCPQSPEQHPTDKQPTITKAKRASKDSSGAAAALPVKATTSGRKKNLKPSSSSSGDSEKQQADKKKVKKSKIKTAKRERPAKTKQTENSDEVFAEPIQDRIGGLDQESDSDSSPLLFPHRERNISSGERIFHKVYLNSSNEKLSFTPEHVLSMGPEEQLSSGEATKQRRKSPGNWWQVSPTPEDLEAASSQPQQLKPKKRKTVGEKKLQTKKPTAHSLSKPLEGAPKQKKRSLAAFTDLCSTVTVSTPVSKKTGTKLKKQQNATSLSAENIEAQHNVVSMETDESRGVHETLQETTSKILRSGPSSMIELENCEEDIEDIVLPSTTVQPALCVSDLCAPPLRPLILQPKDTVNLKDWLKVLWSAKNSGTEITPDDFQWYCYQGRAIGFMVDLHAGSISNGKMLLGSFMKKPLWVDHSATTVFNLLTSSVSVIVDCNKACYNAGQSFMVPSGHAYSIHNLSVQPAVLYFTRIFAEESDE